MLLICINLRQIIFKILVKIIFVQKYIPQVGAKIKLLSMKIMFSERPLVPLPRFQKLGGVMGKFI